MLCVTKTGYVRVINGRKEWSALILRGGNTALFVCMYERNVEPDLDNHLSVVVVVVITIQLTELLLLLWPRALIGQTDNSL